MKLELCGPLFLLRGRQITIEGICRLGDGDKVAFGWLFGEYK